MKFILTFLLGFGLVSCSKQTAEPGNLLTCKINGESWTPKGNISNFFTSALGLNTPPVLKCDYNFYNGKHSLQIIASRYRQDDSVHVSTLDIYLPDVKSSVTYPIQNISAVPLGQPAVHFTTENSCRSSNLYSSQPANGSVTIQDFNATNRTITGFFTFSLPGCGGTMITDGNFNLKF